MGTSKWKYEGIENDQGTESTLDDTYKISKPWYDHLVSFLDETVHNIGSAFGLADEKSKTQLLEEQVASQAIINRNIPEEDKKLQESINNTSQATENPYLEKEINGIDINSMLQKAEEWQQKQWDREDQIRQETQIREDNAIQRKVNDMRAAGVNPNLAYSMSGAESGGGITQATGMNTNPLETFMNNITEREKQAYQQQFDAALKEWETFKNQKFEGDQKEKDRIAGVVDKLISLAGLLGLFA